MGVVAGIDWASETHVCCVIDDGGAVVERFDVTHDASSLRMLTKRLVRLGVSGVAIERGDGPVVEELMDADLPVFVVPSRQVKGLRSRYGSAGNKDDRFDAYVLADTLRTDGHRWTRLREDRGDTKALRALCRARRELVAMRVAALNELRCNLELALPGAIGLFSRPDSPITLTFLRRFPTAAKVAWLSPVRWSGWLRSVGYTGGIPADVLYARLSEAAPGLAGAEGDARGAITLAMVDTVEMIITRITVIEERIGEVFATHPDRGHLRQPAPVGNGARWRTCSLRWVTADRSSRPTPRSLRWPACHPRRGSPANADRPCSAGHVTRSCASP